MLIGFDFDNTIVSYDSLFHKVALERALIPASVPISKVAVRDHLRKIGQESAWTEMQGYVYGARMADAAAYPGVIDFIKRAHAQGIQMAIVSHKTKHPFLGPKYDLHEAARGWVEKFLVHDGVPLVNSASVFFELTKEEKAARIGIAGCDFFIDDLPEILLMEKFPEKTKKILFDPENCHAGNLDIPKSISRLSSWSEIGFFLEAAWKK